MLKFQHSYYDELLLANISSSLNEYTEIGNYYLASKMCPSRYDPLYEQFKAYLAQNKIEDACRMALIIVNMKIKKKTAQVELIRLECENFLLCLTKNN